MECDFGSAVAREKPKNASDSPGESGASESVGNESMGSVAATAHTLPQQQPTPTTSAHSSRQASPVKQVGSSPTVVVQFPQATNEVGPPQQPQLTDAQQVESVAGGTPVLTITPGDVTKNQVVKTKKGRFHVLQDAPANDSCSPIMPATTGSQVPSPIPPLHHKTMERSASIGNNNNNSNMVQQQETGAIRKGRFTLTSATQGNATTIARQGLTQNAMEGNTPPLHPSPPSPAAKQASQQHFPGVHPNSASSVQHYPVGMIPQQHQPPHVSLPLLQHPMAQQSPQQHQVLPQPGSQGQQPASAPAQRQGQQQPISLQYQQSGVTPVQLQPMLQQHTQYQQSGTAHVQLQPGVHYQQPGSAPSTAVAGMHHQVNNQQTTVQYQQPQHQLQSQQQNLQHQQQQQQQQQQQTSTQQPPVIQYQHLQQPTLQQHVQQHQQPPVSYQPLQQPATQSQSQPQPQPQQVATIAAVNASLPNHPTQHQSLSAAPNTQQGMAKVGTLPPTPGREVTLEKVDVTPKQRNVSAKQLTSFDSKPPSSFDSKGVGSTAGLGKIFYFLDQMRSEVTEADRTIKSLNTDMKCLRDKNKELESKLRDMEKRWMDEKAAREMAESKVKSLKKKARELRELKTAETTGKLEEEQAPLAGEFITERPVSHNQSDRSSRSDSLVSLEEIQQQKRNSITLAAAILIGSESIPQELSNAAMKASVQSSSSLTEKHENYSPKPADSTCNAHGLSRIERSMNEVASSVSPLKLRGSSDLSVGITVSGSASKPSKSSNLSEITPMRGRTSSTDTFDTLKSNQEATSSGDAKVSLSQTNGEGNGSGRLHQTTPSTRLPVAAHMVQHIRQQSSPNVMIGHMTMDAMTNQMAKDTMNSQPGMGYLHSAALQQQVQGNNMMMNQNAIMNQMGGISVGNGMVVQGMQQPMMGGVPVQLQGMGQGLGHIQQQLPNVQQMQTTWSQQQQYPISQQQLNQQLTNQQQQQQQQWVQQAVYQQEQQQLVNQQQMMQVQQQQMFPQNQYQQGSTQYVQQGATVSGQQAADPFNTLASRQQQSTPQNQLWNNAGN